MRRRFPALVAVAIILIGIMPAAVRAADPLDIPDVSAESVFAYDIVTGETIYNANADERRPVASLTKIMTALVTLEYREPDAEVVVSDDDMIGPGYSTMWLQVGDTLTVDQLLTGLMLSSGGDAALALARDIGSGLSGSDDPGIAVAAFVDAMNQHASALGLEDTHFANPDGEDSEDAWSTAHDVALMFGEVEKSDTLTGILAQSEYGFVSVGPEQREYGGLTTNELAGQYGVTGAKTGSTEQAGGCLVLAKSANDDQSTVIMALLGSDLAYDNAGMQIRDERWSDAVTLINDIDARWTWSTPDPRPEIAQTSDEPVVETLTPTATTSVAAAASTRITTLPSKAQGNREAFAVVLAGGMVAIASGFTWARLRTGRN